MISRYALYDIAELSNRFQLSEGVPKGIKPHYNISPTTTAPIILNCKGSLIIKPMGWGLVAKGAKDTNSVFRYKTYNIQSERIFSRHSWERAIRESRCLVPANGFYVLNGSGKKRAFYVRPKDGTLFAFAAVYSSWVDPTGTSRSNYSIITIESAIEAPFCNTGVPIIIRREDEARWLDTAISDTSSLYSMLRATPSGLLDINEVSPAVHSPKPDDPTLIVPN